MKAFAELAIAILRLATAMTVGALLGGVLFAALDFLRTFGLPALWRICR
jgi:hypothetical protein